MRRTLHLGCGKGGGSMRPLPRLDSQKRGTQVVRDRVPLSAIRTRRMSRSQRRAGLRVEIAPAWARRVLQASGHHLVGTGKDAADAVAAALTARAYAAGLAVPYGDPAEGVIWVPRALPDQQAGRRSIQQQKVTQTDPALVNQETPGRDRLPCECGCGGVPAGRISRFLPGHDAKLASRLLRESRGSEPT